MKTVRDIVRNNEKFSFFLQPLQFAHTQIQSPLLHDSTADRQQGATPLIKPATYIVIKNVVVITVYYGVKYCIKNTGLHFMSC